MSSSRLSEATVDQLVSIYAEAAEAHGWASDEGDHETANEQHDVLAAAYRKLRGRGWDAQKALLALLDHRDSGVRSWAGGHALEFSPEDGERTLEGLVAVGGLTGFNAEMTLETWRRGVLRFP